MAQERGPVYIDSKTVATVGTTEKLTTRDILCTSVTIKAKAGNTNDVFVVDTATTTIKYPIPAGTSISLPIHNPRLIDLDVTTNGEGVDWIAV